MQPINRIVTHHAPHLDEIAAIWLLKRFGEKEFPGASAAPVEYWSPDMAATPWQDHFAAGTLQLGVGGGRFDEHPTNGRARKAGHCCTSLVARALGIDRNPELRMLLDYVTESDLQGGTNRFDLANMIKTLNRQHPNTPEIVISWTLAALDAHYAQQDSFFNQTPTEYEAKAKEVTVKGAKGRKLKIVTIESDLPDIPSFARSRRGGYAALVIIRKSSGNVAILSNSFYEVSLHDLARIIRIEERRAKGLNRPQDGWKGLETEGTVPGAEEWHYFKEGEMLLNGSPTHPDIPPTRLSLERLTELAVIALSTRSFEPSRQDGCRAGVCSSSPDNPCPWYNLGLSRCRGIRYRMNQAAQSS